jgi:hypothetical protein
VQDVNVGDGEEGALADDAKRNAMSALRDGLHTDCDVVVNGLNRPAEPLGLLLVFVIHRRSISNAYCRHFQLSPSSNLLSVAQLASLRLLTAQWDGAGRTGVRA